MGRINDGLDDGAFSDGLEGLQNLYARSSGISAVRGWLIVASVPFLVMAAGAMLGLLVHGGTNQAKLAAASKASAQLGVTSAGGSSVSGNTPIADQLSVGTPQAATSVAPATTTTTSVPAAATPAATPAVPQTPAVTTPAPAHTVSTVPAAPKILVAATSYSGTLQDSSTGISSGFNMTGVSENTQGKLSGQVSVDVPTFGGGALSGTVSNSGAVNFTVSSQSGVSMSFTGTLNGQGGMSGKVVFNFLGLTDPGTWAAHPA